MQACPELKTDDDMQHASPPNGSTTTSRADEHLPVLNGGAIEHSYPL